MRLKLATKMVACALLLMAFAPRYAECQFAGGTRFDRTNLAFTYNPMAANVVGGAGFWMQGSSVQMESALSRRWGVVTDVAGLHARSIGPGVGLDLITATAGPRFTLSWPGWRVTVFGEGLIGEAHGMDSLFPKGESSVSSANSLAVQLGGGADLWITPRVRLRPLQANWVRTQFPNSTTNVQNSLRLGAGVVYVLRRSHTDEE